MYEDNNKSYSITAEQQKEVELRQEKEFVVYYLRKALIMVGDMAISEAIEQLDNDIKRTDMEFAFKLEEAFKKERENFDSDEDYLRYVNEECEKIAKENGLELEPRIFNGSYILDGTSRMKSGFKPFFEGSNTLVIERSTYRVKQIDFNTAFLLCWRQYNFP